LATALRALSLAPICLFLHRDADVAAARRTAHGLAEKMWWYNRNSFGEKREGSRGPGRRSAGDDAPGHRAGEVTITQIS